MAQFVGSVNLFAGRFRREGDRLRFASVQIGEIDLPPGLEPPSEGSDLAFRPHAVHFDGDGRTPSEGSIRLDGAVEGSEFLGELLRYEIRVGEALVTHPKVDVIGFTGSVEASQNLGHLDCE